MNDAAESDTGPYLTGLPDAWLLSQHFGAEDRDGAVPYDEQVAA